MEKKSKNKCCVPRCFDRISKRHRFPKNDNLLMQKWVENINQPRLSSLQPEVIYNTCFVCDRHFAPEFLVSGTRRGLRRDAVPTLYLSVSSEETSSVEVVQIGDDSTKSVAFLQERSEHLNTEGLAEGISMHTSHLKDIESPSTSFRQEHSCSLKSPSDAVVITLPGSSRQENVPVLESSRQSTETTLRKRKRILQSVNVTRAKDLTPKCRKLYKIVGEWGRKIARVQHKTRNFRKRLFHAEKFAQSTNFTNLMEYVNNTTFTFIMQQVRLQPLQPKARRYTLDEKILSLALFKTSAKGYRLLSKLFCLPSARTLTNMLNKIPYTPGINKQIFNSLKIAVSNFKYNNERLCAVVFDEISIAPMLMFNQTLNYIEGLEDFGKTRTPHIADHANVFMVKGIFRQWKQAVSFTFHKGPIKSTHLKSVLLEVIRECQSIGLEVVATICDQGSANQACINSLIKSSKEECARDKCENEYEGFLVNGKEIIPLFDVPHLFKGIRNNLLTKNLHFKLNGNVKIAKWEHIQQFYLLDTLDDTRLCPKLTDGHIFPKKLKKMKVSVMTQVFSHQVGSLMKRISQWDTHSEHNLPLEAQETGDFILFIDELFDSLNSNSKEAPCTKPLKGGVSKNSPHEQFWLKAIVILESMKFYTTKQQKFVKVPSCINLVKTLKGFLRLRRNLLQTMQYFLPRALNQDCLENFFASIRTHGRRTINPNVSQFTTSFKALLVNNFMSYHSVVANCEEDYATGALDNLKNFVNCDIELAQLLETDVSRVVPPQVIAVKKTRIAKCTIAYFAGYLVKKLIKKSPCESCRSVLLYSDGNVPLDVIVARQYKGGTLQQPGSYLYYVTNKSLSILFHFIPRNCHIGKLKVVLHDILTSEINFNPLNCVNHHELSKLIVDLIIKCILHFWCKQVNKVLLGKDDKFVRFLQKKPDQHLIDPIKLEARKTYLKKIKNKMR